jgi:hypothetical protein
MQMGRYTGTFPSLKNGTNVCWVGHLHRDLCYYLEFDLTVRSYQSHPFKVALVSGTKPFRWTPAMLIVRDTRHEIVVCEWASDVATPEKQREFNLMHRWADDQGYAFGIITDADLHMGPRLANLKLLWRYARLPLPAGLTLRCIRYLSEHPGGIGIDDVATYLADGDDPRKFDRYLYRLLFMHIVQSDLDRPITRESRLWLPVSHTAESKS